MALRLAAKPGYTCSLPRVSLQTSASDAPISRCSCKDAGAVPSSSNQMRPRAFWRAPQSLTRRPNCRPHGCAAMEDTSAAGQTVGSNPKRRRGKKELPPEEAEYQELVQKELEEEAAQGNKYRQLAAQAAQQLEGYAIEDIKEARRTVAKLVMAEEGVEELIMQLADEDKLTDVLLQVIRNRLDLARQDDEKDVVQCLDLLYRRIETERRSRAASPALRLLNELLHLHDGGSDKAWLRRARQRLLDTFVPEDPSLIFLQPGFGGHPPNVDDADSVESEADQRTMYRIDFISELDGLLSQVEASLPSDLPQGQDPASVAARLQLMERLRAVDQVRQLRDLAIDLRW